MLVLLFRSQPDAIADLLDYMQAQRELQQQQQQRQSMQSPLPAPWKRLVQVPVYQRARGFSEQQVQLASCWSDGTPAVEGQQGSGDAAGLDSQGGQALPGRCGSNSLEAPPHPQGGGAEQQAGAGGMFTIHYGAVAPPLLQGHLPLPPMRRSVSATDAAAASSGSPSLPDLRGGSPPAGPSLRGNSSDLVPSPILATSSRPPMSLTHQASTVLPLSLSAKNFSASGQLSPSVEQQGSQPAASHESKR